MKKDDVTFFCFMVLGTLALIVPVFINHDFIPFLFFAPYVLVAYAYVMHRRIFGTWGGTKWLLPVKLIPGLLKESYKTDFPLNRGE